MERKKRRGRDSGPPSLTSTVAASSTASAAASGAGAESESDDEQPEIKQFKVILLGDGTVGKTSIVQRYTTDTFGANYKQTIGVDFFSKRIELPGNVVVTLQLWDVGGQSIGSKMVRHYIAGAHAVLLTYDITNLSSFQNLEDWYRLVMNTFELTTMPYVGLVANKTDMGHLRQIRVDDHNRFADENDMFSFCMSAKSGDQVNACFLRVAAQLAGVTVTKMDTEASTNIVTAKIINHQQHDPAVNEGKVPEYSTKSGCLVS